MCARVHRGYVVAWPCRCENSGRARSPAGVVQLLSRCCHSTTRARPLVRSFGRNRRMPHLRSMCVGSWRSLQPARRPVRRWRGPSGHVRPTCWPPWRCRPLCRRTSHARSSRTASASTWNSSRRKCRCAPCTPLSATVPPFFPICAATVDCWHLRVCYSQ